MGQLGPDGGISAGEQGLGGMDVPRFSRGSVGIKAGSVRRQLSNNNARDQGKASKQVFLYIPVP